MSKIIVRRQEYANNGTHANEIEAVVKENLIANTLSSATDIAPSVGLLKSISDSLEGAKNVFLDKTYGSSGVTINIDTLNSATGYIYKCFAGSTFSGTSPTSVLGGNAFMLIGFSSIKSSNNLPIYGVQMAIGFGSSKIAIRNAYYNTEGSAWGVWREI